MTSENLQRTSYRDPNLPSDPVRSGTPTLSENERDMDQYYRPLERIHGSNLHGWGVASGLSVTATLNSASPTLTIQPGVALDSSGQHISLAPPGNLAVQSYAEVGTNPTGLSTGATLVPVTTSGVVVPTTSSLTGDMYLTIQFWETFDSTSYNNQGLFIYWHTPWLQLVNVTGFTNDGSRVVLAKVSFGTGATAGQVTALTQGLRQATDLPVGSMHLQRTVQSTTAGNATVEAVEAGVLQAYASGGLQITIPNSTDEIHLECDNGTNFAKVSLGAEKIVARKGDGTTESVVIDTEAGSLTASGAITGGSISTNGAMTVAGSITAGSLSTSGGVTASGAITGGSISTSDGVTASRAITTSSDMIANGYIMTGTSGSSGEVIVNDAQGNASIVLDGGIATVKIGNAGSAGVLQIQDNTGNTVCSLNGQTGTILAQGDISTQGNIDASNTNASTFIRQNGLYMSGEVGWSSLSYNAHHNDANNNWVFPDPSHTAVTIEMDDVGGTPRFQVWSTTPGNPTGWVERFAIDGNSGNTWTSGNMAANGTITSGTSGANGEVIVNDANNNPAIVLNGGIATVEIGNADNAGVLEILNTSGQAVCNISGQNGKGSFASVLSQGTVLGGNQAQGGWGVAGFNSGPGVGVHAGNGGNTADLGTSSFAGDFSGDVSIGGNLTKTSGSFKIDHPLDPANRYLSHSFVESPDMKNIYDGVAVLDEDGEAIVELPHWFEALNRDFRYQLTCIDGFAPVYIARKVHDNYFKIAGGKPEMEVSWQVTGIRKDAWANAHPLLVEEDKPSVEQGYYLHPELYGAPEEKNIRRLRYPEDAQ